MSSEPDKSSPTVADTPRESSAQRTQPPQAEGGAANPSGMALRIVGLLALLGVLGAGFVWQKVSGIQEQLARQTADTGSQALEAKAAAKQAQELSRDTAAKLTLTDTKLNEVALQRSQLEELMQSLSRSRDENLVVDIESAIRLAQQQAQLTGSIQPLLAALRTAEQRLAKVSQPRLAPLQRALARDIERVKTAAMTDTPGLLIKMDELVRWVDELPLVNAVGIVNPPGQEANHEAPSSSWARAISASWWERVLRDIWGDVRGLVRVSRLDQPEASLLAPDQSYFVRENLKLRLLNARLGLLARQPESARTDLSTVQRDLGKYFDVQSRKGQLAMGLLKQVQTDMQQIDVPRIDETMTALTTAAAGR